MSKMNNIFKACWGGLILCLCSCGQTIPDDPLPEDYDKLFPFGSISGPEESESVLPLRPCDPSLSLEDYKDLSNKNSTGRTTYEVSFSAAYYVRDREGELVTDPEILSRTRFSIKYIDSDGRICHVYSHEAVDGYSEDIEEVSSSESPVPDHIGESYLLRNGEPLILNFTVKSGYPLYLSLDGVADSESEVKASIRAVARDGSVIVPKLEVHQFQNKEGVDRLSQPYCNYIILP